MGYLDDFNYEKILHFIETGAQGDLPDELIEYVRLLEIIRSMYDRYQSIPSIVNFLQKPPFGLSEYVAKKRFNEAINLFYADNEIKKQTWRNVYAARLDRAADLALLASTSVADLEVYKKIVDAAARMRQLDLQDDRELPPELFQRPFKIYTLDPEKIGRKRADRNLLAQQIDSLAIPEKEKDKARSDAMITDIELFADGDQEDTETE